jgi:hypothetical protein
LPGDHQRRGTKQEESREPIPWGDWIGYFICALDWFIGEAVDREFETWPPARRTGFLSALAAASNDQSGGSTIDLCQLDSSDFRSGIGDGVVQLRYFLPLCKNM